MPAPLPPLRLQQQQRLNFLRSPRLGGKPSSGGLPTDPFTVQLHADFSPITGEGNWRYIHFPRDVEFDDWEVFERFCRRHLPIPKDQFDFFMDYLHNFKTLNLDLKTGEVYPVIPRPTGFNAPVPIPAMPGPYLGGEGGGKG